MTGSDRQPSSQAARVAVVTIAHGRHRHLRRQHESLAVGSRLPDHYLVVAMGDHEIQGARLGGLDRDVVRVPATPTALPLAAARNRGVRRALHCGADVVIVLDVDCLAGPHLVEGYCAAVARGPGALWSGPVTYLPPEVPPDLLQRLEEFDQPHPARPRPGPGEYQVGAEHDLFWSLSFAVAARLWRRLGGFSERYLGYGAEDTDFGRMASARGVPMGWTGTARAYHQHHPVSDPPVEHLDAILRNGAIFASRWGEWPMTGWLEAFERQGLVRRSRDGWERA